MKTLNASERTQAQEKNFRRMLQDIAEHATKVALDKVLVDRETFQKNVLEKGDKLRDAVTSSLVAMMQELTFSLLKRQSETVSVPAIEEMVITEKLLKDEYNVRWFGDNFKRLFFGKKIKAAPAGTTAFHLLQENSLDKPIIDELGDGAKTCLGRMLWLVKQQSKGANGPLLVNGYANIGYIEVEIEHGKTELWAVSFRWDSGNGYWDVGADPVDYPDEWNEGGQVLSSDC